MNGAAFLLGESFIKHLRERRRVMGSELDSHSDQLLHCASAACFSFNYPVRFGQTGSFSADAGG